MTLYGWTDRDGKQSWTDSAACLCSELARKVQQSRHMGSIQECYIYRSALLSVYAATSVASTTPTPCGSRCCRQNAQVWPQQWVVNNNMIITTSLEWRGADLGLVPHVELLTRLRMLARAHWDAWCARGVAGPRVKQPAS